MRVTARPVARACWSASHSAAVAGAEETAWWGLGSRCRGLESPGSHMGRLKAPGSGLLAGSVGSMGAVRMNPVARSPLVRAWWAFDARTHRGDSRCALTAPRMKQGSGRDWRARIWLVVM